MTADILAENMAPQPIELLTGGLVKVPPMVAITRTGEATHERYRTGADQ